MANDNSREQQNTQKSSSLPEVRRASCQATSAQIQQKQLVEQAIEQDCNEVHHLWHFVITLATCGVWALVWWHLVLRAQGRKGQIFHGFDDAYWSYLIEREQPPAALHRQQFDRQSQRAKPSQFDA
ncbi:hypothetical protein [Shewanella waksmanii]|uniref:hypothetical protein n=1 Tax=Shewanella waksmanii TaxID=213783 RepID=UPI00373634C2